MAIGEQAGKGDRDELLSFAPLTGGDGVEIVDRIERRHFTLLTGDPVTPEETAVDEFEFPVSRAFSVRTSELTIPNQLGAVVRNSLGFMVSEVTKDESRTFPADTYSLDPGAPVKTYLRFDSPFSISVSSSGIQIDFHGETRVCVGIRSVHQRPAATITITDDVSSLMRAASYFGSALKTTSCERSYPTLRGHPPTIEMGDSLDVPSVLSRPETGIRIEVPDEWGDVYTVAPLAYYLGAEVVSAEHPRLIADTGLVHSLAGGDRDFEAEVERVLKQTFFLDCITRTEGFFQVNLHERNQIEGTVDLDFSELYNAPIAEQLEAYLEVPHHLIEPYLPNWKLTAHISQEATHAEVLPFLVNDLALIKTVADRQPTSNESGRLDIGDFVRRGKGLEKRPTGSGIESAPTPTLIRVEESDSMEQTWIGDGAPIGASKGMIEAFRNRLGRTPTEHDIDITVVCNAAEMNQEGDDVNDVYGSREELPFDVTVHHGLTTEELRGVLEKDMDFLHYIGHIDAGGFECVDGRFDAATLDRTGVDTFFLNACTSYDQGRELIRSGSIAGVVTLQDVINSGAERVGKTLARLLNGGFPLNAALEIAKTESIMGGHYLVIGDAGMEIAQPQGHVPALCEIHGRGDQWNLEYITFPTMEDGLGTIAKPALDACDEFYLASGYNGGFEVSEKELIEFLKLEEMPIRIERELMWSSEFPVEPGYGPE